MSFNSTSKPSDHQSEDKRSAGEEAALVADKIIEETDNTSDKFSFIRTSSNNSSSNWGRHTSHKQNRRRLDANRPVCTSQSSFDFAPFSVPSSPIGDFTQLMEQQPAKGFAFTSGLINKPPAQMASTPKQPPSSLQNLQTAQNDSGLGKTVLDESDLLDNPVAEQAYIDEWQKKYEQSVKENKTLQEKLDIQKRELDEKERQINKLNERYQQVEQEKLDMQKRELDEKDEKINNLNERCQQIEQDKKQMMEKLQKQDEQKAEENRTQSMDAALLIAQDTDDKLKQILKATATKCETLVKEKKKLSEKLDMQKRALDKKDEKIEQVCTDNKETMEKLQKKNEENNTLSEEIESLRLQMGEKENQIRDAQVNREQLKQACHIIREKLEERERHCLEKEAELQETKEEISMLRLTLNNGDNPAGTGKIQMLKARLLDVETQLKEQQMASEANILQLKEDKNALIAECDRIKTELDKIKRQKEDIILQLEDNNHGLNLNLNHLTTELQEMRDTCQAEVSRLTGDNSALNFRCDNLTQQLQMTELQAQNYQQTAAQLEESTTNEIMHLRERVKTLQTEGQNKEEKLKGLIDTIARQSCILSDKEKLERDLQETQVRLKECQERSSSLETQLTESSSQNQQMESFLSENRKMCSEMKSGMYDLNYELKELKAQLAHSNDRGDALDAKCSRLSELVEELQNEKRNLIQEKSDLEEQARQTEEEKTRLLLQYRVLEGQKKTVEEQAMAFGQQEAILRIQAVQWQTMYKEKEKQFLSTTTNHAQQMEELTDRLRRKELEMVPLEVEAQRATLEARILQTQLERLTEEKRNLEQVIKVLKEDIQKGLVEINLLQKRLEMMQENSSSNQRQKERYLKESRHAREEVRILQAQLRRLQGGQFEQHIPRP